MEGRVSSDRGIFELEEDLRIAGVLGHLIIKGSFHVIKIKQETKEDITFSVVVEQKVFPDQVNVV